jgi:hypothetical protein
MRTNKTSFFLPFQVADDINLAKSFDDTEMYHQAQLYWPSPGVSAI